MKVFDHTHAKGEYWQHLKRAGTIAGLFIACGLIGMIHAVVPFFLPEFLTLANAHIKERLNAY
jgi:hypothetical protein